VLGIASRLDTKRHGQVSGGRLPELRDECALVGECLHARKTHARKMAARRKGAAEAARTATAASFDPDGIVWTRFVNQTPATPNPFRRPRKKEISITVFAQVHFSGFTK